MRRKHSIKVRMVVTLGGLLAVTIFFCWFANKTFLEKYYEQSKIKNFGEIYEQVEDIYAKLGSDEEVSLYLEKTGSRQSTNLYIFNLYMYSGGLLFQVKYPSNLNNFQLEQLKERVWKYSALENVMGMGRGTGETLYQTDDYAIYKQFDEKMDAFYIELFGKLSNGEFIFMRSNFYSIQESAVVANRFLAYTGLMVMVVGIFLAYFIGKSFTEPVQQLSGIAREISNLNFDVKYETKRQDEIAELGHSINVLSEQLKTKMSELKSANNELQSDIEKKEKIDEMRKEFLSNVSHELKTPIALIQGYAEGLKDNISDDAESREFYCDVIIDEAAKMNNMVKKLLTLNQLEFGSDQIEFERFDIVTLIRSVLHSVGIMFRQKEVLLDFPQCDPVYVWADEYRVEEVVTNYISNALNHVAASPVTMPEPMTKEAATDAMATGIMQGTAPEAMPPEAPQVWQKRISVRLIKKEGQVRVSVFNTGQPIPEADIDQIWDKFYKVDKARTREYGGSGIGLSIVKAIMNSMNQKCGVINWENGVEFWFELDMQS